MLDYRKEGERKKTFGGPTLESRAIHRTGKPKYFWSFLLGKIEEGEERIIDIILYYF